MRGHVLLIKYRFVFNLYNLFYSSEQYHAIVSAVCVVIIKLK